MEKALGNVSLWEVKSYVRKAQNAMLNLTDVEAKVREATNNEPWGASTTLMAEIARATFSYKDREEVCNMIFRRFTEKSVREWRQIYKSLVLMEYLVKNASERFVDDARANVALVTMLKSFHYIDSKGVDQGINVRNRARELASLLNDEAAIREERKKAKDNAKKFASSGSGGSGTHGGISRRTMGGGAAGGSFGDAYETRVFGDGGVYGQRYEEQRSGAGGGDANAFEEYDIEPNRANPTVETSRVNAHAKEHLPAGDDDDDFDDFQSATPVPASAGASAGAGNDLMDLLDFNTTSNANVNVNTIPTYTPVQHTSVNAAAPTMQYTPVQAKKDDIFGDLLKSAKAPSSKAQPTKSPMKTTTTQNFDSLLDL